MSRPGLPWLLPAPVLTQASAPPNWSRPPLREPAVGILDRFRKHTRHNGKMTPEASLAEAEAAVREQRRKLAGEQMLHRRLDRIDAENDLARKFREAFGGNR
jgi:hypothetical protein